jgi:hypothetical protein
MPEAGPLTWGPYTLMPGATVTFVGPVTVTPGGGGDCTVVDTAGNQYRLTAAGGGGWIAVLPDRTHPELAGPMELPGGCMLQVQASPEEMARQEELARQAQEAESARQEAYDQRSELADARLLEWLSEEQRRTYGEYRWFSLTASDGSPWRIIADGSYSGNVLQLDRNGQPVCSYCAHPRSCPPSETYLAQALAIVSDVARFKTVANLYCRYQPSVVNVVSAGEYTSVAGGAAWSGLLQALRR